MIKNYLKESNPDKIINSPNNSDEIKQQLTIFKEKIVDKNIAERFIGWFQQQLQKAEKNNEDLSDITKNAVAAINIVAKSLPPKDIKKINPFDLKNIEQIYPIINKLNPDFERAESVSNNDDLEKVFENDEALVINVKTFDGSYFLSQGNDNWCTSQSRYSFDDYIKNGPIFRIYIKKPVSEKYKKCSIAHDRDRVIFSNHDNREFDPTNNNLLSYDTYDEIMSIYDEKFNDGNYEEREIQRQQEAIEPAIEDSKRELEELIEEFSDEKKLVQINDKFGPRYVYDVIIDALGSLAHTSDDWLEHVEFKHDGYGGYDAIYDNYAENPKAIRIIKNKLYELGCLHEEHIQWVENNRFYPKDPNQMDLFKSESLRKYLSEGISPNRKIVKEIKLKNNDVIPINSNCSVEFFGDKEPNGNTRCRLKINFIGESGRNYHEEPLNIKIETLSVYVSGFKEPSIKTMEKWAYDGIALTPTGKRVEPDGYGPDDSPSWLLVLGFM